MGNILTNPIFWIIAVVVLLILWVIGTANKITRRKITAEKAFADVDAFLTQRSDVVLNLVETVKGYAKHEKGTLTEVVEARNKAVNASSQAEKMEADNQLTGALSRFFALAEDYPELKANENFLQLQDKITALNEDLTAARRYFNAAAGEYNVLIRSIPSNIVASIFGHKEMELYKATEEERKNPKVDFSDLESSK